MDTDAASASTSDVKNEPKDHLAQAMDEMTGGGGKNDDDADKSKDDMDGASRKNVSSDKTLS